MYFYFQVEGANIIHSFGAMLVMLAYIICYGKEEGVLSRLEDLNLCVGEEGSDPLNVTASNQADLPQTVMARYNVILYFNHYNVKFCMQYTISF